MNLKTHRWNVSEYLEMPEKRTAYLEAALEDGDPKLIAVVLTDISKAVKQAATNLE
jgi:DNA-binding phage protein